MSLAKNVIGPAISHGWAMCLIGTMASSCAFAFNHAGSSGARPPLSMGVSTSPGATTFTRMPCSAYWLAACLLKPIVAHLEVAYAGGHHDVSPQIDATFTMTPGVFAAVHACNCAVMHLKVPSMFTRSSGLLSKLSMKPASPICKELPNTPALLTATSKPPSSSLVRLMASQTAVALEMSTAAHANFGVVGQLVGGAMAVRLAQACCVLATLWPTIITEPHSKKKASTAARPMPLSPPVTKITLSAKRGCPQCLGVGPAAPARAPAGPAASAPSAPSNNAAASHARAMVAGSPVRPGPLSLGTHASREAGTV
mmetsp:Transcript_38434/g.116227  ORF Transcript_38434/g.116227 Transcript_38434/m.116227 type:complete len:312 (+) Transcript_38434:441-1376(+)